MLGYVLVATCLKPSLKFSFNSISNLSKFKVNMHEYMYLSATFTVGYVTPSFSRTTTLQTSLPEGPSGMAVSS